MDNIDFSKTFFVLDFDRCTGNTEKFHTVLETMIEKETPITAAELTAAKESRDGQTFDTIDYVRRMLAERQSDVTWQQVQQEFIKQAKRQDMLMPHARELISVLEKKSIPYGIVTYGGEAWQLAKLEAAGFLDIPHIVTHIQEKGVILTGWKHGDEFIVPPALTREFKPLTVSSIVFLDDKTVSFHDIPEGVRGVHVRPPDGFKIFSSQKGSLPTSVASVNGLAGAIELLFG